MLNVWCILPVKMRGFLLYFSSLKLEKENVRKGSEACNPLYSFTYLFFYMNTVKAH